MTKRIVFEDPTPASRGRNNGNVQGFLTKLGETPDRWAVYTRDAKYISYYYTIASKRNDVKVAIRRNGNSKTSTVYFMVLSEAGTKSRIEEKAARGSRKVAKKAVGHKPVKPAKRTSV
jgi:hypothetical protein